MREKDETTGVPSSNAQPPVSPVSYSTTTRRPNIGRMLVAMLVGAHLSRYKPATKSIQAFEEA